MLCSQSQRDTTSSLIISIPSETSQRNKYWWKLVPGLGPHVAEDPQFFASPSPQDSQVPFMNMTINTLQTGWTLMDCVSSVSDCEVFLSPIFLQFKIFPLRFYISSPGRCIFFSFTYTSKGLFQSSLSSPCSLSLHALAVNKTSLSKAAITEEPQEFPFLVLPLFWCTDYPLVGSIAHLLLGVF